MSTNPKNELITNENSTSIVFTVVSNNTLQPRANSGRLSNDSSSVTSAIAKPGSPLFGIYIILVVVIRTVM